MPPTTPSKPRPQGLSHRQHVMIALSSFAILAAVAVLVDYEAWQQASPVDPVPGPLDEPEDQAATRAADDAPRQSAFGNATVVDGGSPEAGP